MMKKREGIDVVVEIGGIKTPEAVLRLFDEKMDAEQFDEFNRSSIPKLG